MHPQYLSFATSRRLQQSGFRVVSMIVSLLVIFEAMKPFYQNSPSDYIWNQMMAGLSDRYRQAEILFVLV